MFAYFWLHFTSRDSSLGLTVRHINFSVLDKKQFASLVNTKTDPEELRKLRSENRNYVKTIKRVKKDLNSKLKMFQEILDDRLDESSSVPISSSVKNDTCHVEKVYIAGHHNHYFMIIDFGFG